MLVGYPEGSHLTAPPLVLESRPQVLGTHALRTRSDSSSSAIAPRMSMGKALDAPGNARPTKRARVSNTRASQEASQATIIPEESENEEDNKDILEEKKQNKTLTTKYNKGKGKIKERVFDEKYTCNIFDHKRSDFSGSMASGSMERLDKYK
ncbi:uncharacterized protein K444DRAFT_633629 [Hyaloscypha bicolor E]|uniref:Uncharacterized protein n=1 Tax=Hyaloscypha bicolor E TaxID=1095630 RepID=A0A2J6SXK5_9HELO|nr:uncharacterized protein K444DRAFT_633629 [Hyaloscypha bicolor E]PMD55494.1 hypothetical protein K444DRAFT_633629 [Hyaloscypha bicolor E]